MAQNSMGLGPIQVNQPSAFKPANQPNEQQMLAQALRGQQQAQPTEEEKMIIMQIMQQQNLSEEQAIQQYMRMKSG